MGKTVSKVDDLASQAKKYKSADEFVKAQLDKNSYITKEPIKLYRGEGKGIGNTTFVKGKYYTDSKDMAKQFGKVTESELPAGTKVFDFDNIKNNFKQNIIPQELLVDDEKLTQYLILNGYNVTKNTTARGGIEYVLLKDKYAELGRLRKQFKTDIKFGEYITGEGYELNKELLGRNEIGDLDIAKRIMKSKYFKNNQLTDIWNQANKK